MKLVFVNGDIVNRLNHHVTLYLGYGDSENSLNDLIPPASIYYADNFKNLYTDYLLRYDAPLWT